MKEHYYKDSLLYQALQARYMAEMIEAKANIEVYLDKHVGVAEHPNIVESLDKLIEQYSNAEEKLKLLEEKF